MGNLTLPHCLEIPSYLLYGNACEQCAFGILLPIVWFYVASWNAWDFPGLGCFSRRPIELVTFRADPELPYW